MDPAGCLATAGGDYAPPPFFGRFVFGSAGFIVLTSAAWAYASCRQSRRPPATLGHTPDFGVQGAATVALLAKLCIAFALPAVIAYGGLLAANAGASASALGDMACSLGGSFPVLAALFGSLAVVFVAISPLRLRTRHALARSIVDAAAASAGGLGAPRSIVLLSAGRGLLAAPLAVAAGSSGRGVEEVAPMTLVAVDAWGTPQCTDSKRWLQCNFPSDLAAIAGTKSLAATPGADGSGCQLRVAAADFSARDPPPAAADGSGAADAARAPSLQSRVPLAASAADLVVIGQPGLWPLRSEVPQGETVAARAVRVANTLAEARRLLRPGATLAAVVPVTRASRALQALRNAGLIDARQLRGWHVLGLVPTVVVVGQAPAAAAAAGGCGDSSDAVAPAKEAIRGIGDEAAADYCDDAADPARRHGCSLQLVVRAACFLLTACIGAGAMALCLDLLSQHWDAVGGAVEGPAPGLPFSSRLSSMSLNIQSSYMTGVLLVLDAMWTAASAADRTGCGVARSAGSAATESGGEPLLRAATPRTTTSFSWHAFGADVASCCKALLFALLGTTIMQLIQWLPVFCVDLAWLAAAPGSTGPMHAVNQVVSGVVPFVVVQLGTRERAPPNPPAAAAAAVALAEAPPAHTGVSIQ